MVKITSEKIGILVIGLMGLAAFNYVMNSTGGKEKWFLGGYAFLMFCFIANADKDSSGMFVCAASIVFGIEIIYAARSDEFPEHGGTWDVIFRAAMFTVTLPCFVVGICLPCILLSDKSDDSSEDKPSLLDQILLTVEGLRGRTDIPRYWANAGKDLEQALDRDSPDFFDEMYPVPLEQRKILQGLLDASAGGNKLRLVRALRVEDSRMWAAYQQKAAEINEERGDLDFVGDQGAPLTVAQMKSLSGFSVLDEDVCEAYLWHATKPEAAMKIAEDGFDIGLSSTTRFGEGGYFAEDPMKSNSYAQAGDGLYKDCFAMLLCRVVLGQQYHVTTGYDTGATRSAKPDNDSTIAEPPGEPREFIVFENTQIYPEYAIVYNRVSEDQEEENPYWDDEDADAWMDCIPAYWAHAGDTRTKFDEMYPCRSMETIIQGMMDATFKRKATKDRKGDLPSGLRVLKVLRVEDSDMWWEYYDKQQAISEARGACSRWGDEFKTSTALGLRERRRLNTLVNEAYLWHGSSPSAVMSIAQDDFNIGMSSTTAMFGQGAYFGECSSKADEYASDDADGYYKGYYAMLLCRVTLGEMQYLTEGDHNAHTRVGPTLDFDSTLGDRETAVGTYREFIITSKDQVYPEYAIIYERVYDDEHGRVRGRIRLDQDTEITRADGDDEEEDSQKRSLLCCEV